MRTETVAQRRGRIAAGFHQRQMAQGVKEPLPTRADRPLSHGEMLAHMRSQKGKAEPPREAAEKQPVAPAGGMKLNGSPAAAPRGRPQQPIPRGTDRIREIREARRKGVRLDGR